MSKETDLRDFFAGLALQYFLENTKSKDAASADMEWEEMIAVQAYMLADAMLKEREAGK